MGIAEGRDLAGGVDDPVAVAGGGRFQLGGPHTGRHQGGEGVGGVAVEDGVTEGVDMPIGGDHPVAGRGCCGRHRRVDGRSGAGPDEGDRQRRRGAVRGDGQGGRFEPGDARSEGDLDGARPEGRHGVGRAGVAGDGKIGGVGTAHRHRGDGQGCGAGVGDGEGGRRGGPADGRRPERGGEGRDGGDRAGGDWTGCDRSCRGWAGTQDTGQGGHVRCSQPRGEVVAGGGGVGPAIDAEGVVVAGGDVVQRAGRGVQRGVGEPDAAGRSAGLVEQGARRRPQRCRAARAAEGQPTATPAGVADGAVHRVAVVGIGRGRYVGNLAAAAGRPTRRRRRNVGRALVGGERPQLRDAAPAAGAVRVPDALLTRGDGGERGPSDAGDKGLAGRVVHRQTGAAVGPVAVGRPVVP